jgi:HAD superfamily hydrolase (TIGR01509 family)
VICAVLFDLDDVVRYFEPCDIIEKQFSLPPGSLTAIAFSPELLQPTVLGRQTYAQWIAGIGAALAAEYGGPARRAADAFAVHPAHVDDAVLGLIRRLRDSYRVALVTNGTDRVETELAALGIDGDFDAIFNSWRIGFAKPDRRIFEYVTAALDVDPTACVFIDDNAAKLEGAREIGMRVVHYTGYDSLVEKLRLFEVVA